MVNSPLYIIFSIVVNFAMWLIFLRFMMQFAGVDKKNPIVKTTYMLTKIVDIYARIFPNYNKGRLSLSAFVLLFLLFLMGVAGRASILGAELTAIELFFAGSIQAVLLFLTALRWMILIAIVVSFIVILASKTPPMVESIIALVNQMAEPIVAPFRKYIPPLGMFDLSPLAAMLLLSLLSKVIEIFATEIWLKM